MAGIHDVRYYDSEMTGAPAPGLYGAGKMIALLDACLVNGFNLHPVEQIVVAAGVATATTSDEHGFRDYTVIRVVGCAEPALNGDWKSDVVAGTTFSWTTTVADGVYGGTMSAKTAPLGWTKEFSGTNVAVYRPKDGVRHYFRIDDSYASSTLMSGYIEKSDSSVAGVGKFPELVDYDLFKQTDDRAVRWFLAGDGAAVYLINAPLGLAGDTVTTQYGDFYIRGWGEIVSYIPGDQYGSFVSSLVQGANYNYSAAWPGITYPGTDGGMTICKNSAGTSADGVRVVGSAFVGGWGSSAAAMIEGLNPADSAMLFHYPVAVQEATSLSVRGEMPGLWQPINRVFSKRNTIETVDGRRILLKQVGDAGKVGSSYSPSNGSGLIGIDITGPWR